MSSEVRLDVGRASVLCLCHGTGFGVSYRLFSIHVPFVVVGVVVLPDAISVSLLRTHKLCRQREYKQKCSWCHLCRVVVNVEDALFRLIY